MSQNIHFEKSYVINLANFALKYVKLEKIVRLINLSYNSFWKQINQLVHRCHDKRMEFCELYHSFITAPGHQESSSHLQINTNISGSIERKHLRTNFTHISVVNFADLSQARDYAFENVENFPRSLKIHP